MAKASWRPTGPARTSTESPATGSEPLVDQQQAIGGERYRRDEEDEVEGAGVTPLIMAQSRGDVAQAEVVIEDPRGDGSGGQLAVALLQEDGDGDFRVPEGRVAGEPAVLLVRAVRPPFAELRGSRLAGNGYVAALGRPCRAAVHRLAHAFAHNVQVAPVDAEVASHGLTGERQDTPRTVAHFFHDGGRQNVAALAMAVVTSAIWSGVVAT